MIDAITKGKSEAKPKESLIGEMFQDYLLKPSIWTSLSYINLLVGYFAALLLLSGKSMHYWYLAVYIPFVYIVISVRDSRSEQTRLEIAHRIPYFADALANALSIGSPLEQAFTQASYYLKGKIKEEFDHLVIMNRLGKDLGESLRELDAKFPRTGLRYLISLLDKYKELGVGISPLLKKISIALTEKEEAEEKIRTILAAGSGYARLTISVFVLIFMAMGYMLKEQVALLVSPSLKPALLFLLAWTCTGVVLVTRITSMDFARNFALRPYISGFMKQKNWTIENLMYYSPIAWTKPKQLALYYFPLTIAFINAYLISLYSGEPTVIITGFLLGFMVTWYCLTGILKGMIEDELIRTIEAFPEVLQVFIIGLNSGLNTYLAFQFAQEAIKGDAPKILTEELARAKFAMECGEDRAKTWQRLAEMLPFETVIDFSEIMVIVPMQGESIIRSVTQMTNSYQAKKLTLMEKKATQLGQLVIPLIVLAFFPLFLFAVFAPLIVSMGNSFRI